MESFIRDVRDIDSADRRAIEHVVGKTLSENQRLVIQVVSIDLNDSVKGADDAQRTGSKLPEWCNVYEGLSDSEIEEVEKIALTRADLTRPSE